MKRIFTLLIIVLAFYSTKAQTPRHILVEEFTNASSSACAFLNPNFDTLMANNASKVVLIKYPKATTTTEDTLYNQAAIDLNIRAAYYGGVSGVPQVYMDGNVLVGVSPSAVTQAQIDTQVLDSSFISIELDHTLSTALDVVNISCKIKNENTVQFFGGRKLRIALIEKQIHATQPFGSNGEQVFNGIVRKLLPDSTLSSIAVGDSFMLTTQVTIPSYIYNAEQLAVVAYVQNDNNKEVYQAQMSAPKPLPAGANVVDASIVSATAQPNGWCAHNIVPKITVSNKGDSTITNFEVAYQLNGAAPVSLKFSGTLTTNQDTIISFPNITLAKGESVLSYSIDSINGTATDFNLSNNLTKSDTIFLFSAVATDTTIEEGFQGYSLNTAAPTDAILQNPSNMAARIVDNTISGAPSHNLGAFNLSNGCFQWDFFNAVSGQHATLVFDKVDLSNTQNNALGFSHAYAQVGSENDSLIVLASTDCGDTWVSIWAKAGADLKTASSHSSNTFYPDSSEWVTNQVDISNYDGMSGVMFAFKGVSNYGNDLYLDDINISKATGLKTTKQEDLTMSLYPNPTNGSIHVSLEGALEPTQILVYNTLGQAVEQDVLLGETTISIDLERHPAGTYYVLAIGDNFRLHKKLIKR
ncbi:MAG: Omp28-related outer membrane protein [Aureispira sp.]|nr:Omp28-related outer membrane protein [Aureispira sp.]